MCELEMGLFSIYGKFVSPRRSNWVVCPATTHSPRLSNRSFAIPNCDELFKYAMSDLPDDIERSSIIANLSSSGSLHKMVSVTGLGGSFQVSCESQRSPCVKEAWKEAFQLISDNYGWVPERIIIQGDERFLFDCLMEGKLRVISDGSFKNKLGSAVVQLRPLAKGHVIWVYCQTPGRMSDQSPYWSELIGILGRLLELWWQLGSIRNRTMRVILRLRLLQRWK